MAQKLAFIHLMRTGGSFVLAKLFAAGVPVLCPWVKDLNRDWSRGELYSLARTGEGCVHSHAVAWDQEMNFCVLKHGWLTFTVLRDPLEQLSSLWRFCGRQETLDEFILKQYRGEEYLGLDFHQWAVPEWWQEIGRLIRYQDEMADELLPKLGLPAGPPVPRQNACPGLERPNAWVREKFMGSRFYDIYRQAWEAAS